MNRNHNEILQDDEAFTGLAATSPHDPNYQFYYHQTGSTYNGLGYGAYLTLDNANLYSNQRGTGPLTTWGKTRENYSSERAADQLTRSGYTHNGDNVFHQPADLTFSFLTQEALDVIGRTGTGNNANKGLEPLTEAAKSQALKSMQAWADVANVTFTEAQSTDLNHRADITFAYYT